MLAVARQRLIGADPLDVQQLAVGLYSLAGGLSPTFGGANIEIALWDALAKCWRSLFIASGVGVTAN